MLRYTIGLDWDDVIAPFNSLACEMLNEELAETGRPEEEFVTIHDIESWNNTGKASGIKKFYHDQRLYERQTTRVTDAAKAAVRELMEIADVYIITAPFQQFMSYRAQQIMEIFPEIGFDHIILGSAKNMVHFDFTLDDNINNVLNSPAEYPVLFRKPWNSEMTGLLSVNSLEEFVCLVRAIITPTDVKQLLSSGDPFVIALVGPSGSGKNKVADLLSRNTFQIRRTAGFTTNPNDTRRMYITEEKFRQMHFMEKTRYAGYAYGIEEAEVEDLLSSGVYPVVPIDICGAIGMKRHFPTLVVYLKRSKCAQVRDIITDASLTDDEKALRILSLEAERKNETICDMVIDSDDAYLKIRDLLPQ